MQKPTHGIRKPMKKQKDIITEISEDEETKGLFLIMQKFWFDEIYEGEKDIEYRDDTPFYRSRFLTKDGKKFRNFKTVVMQAGYHSDARRMTVEIKKFVHTFEFEIHLGKILDTNF